MNKRHSLKHALARIASAPWAWLIFAIVSGSVLCAKNAAAAAMYLDLTLADGVSTSQPLTSANLNVPITIDVWMTIAGDNADLTDDVAYLATYRVRSINLSGAAVTAGGVPAPPAVFPTTATQLAATGFVSLAPLNGTSSTGTGLNDSYNPYLVHQNPTTGLIDLGPTDDASQPYVGGTPGVGGDTHNIAPFGVTGANSVQAYLNARGKGTYQIVGKSDRLPASAVLDSSGNSVGTENAFRLLAAQFKFIPTSLGTGVTELQIFQTTSTLSGFRGGQGLNGSFIADGVAYDGTSGMVNLGDSITFTSAVPEPSSLVLVGLGMLACCWLGRRRSGGRR
jgi:hypothetical protein